MLRSASVLLAVVVLVFASLALAAAQPDERIGNARRLQRDAAEDLRRDRIADGLTKAREALALREATLGPDHADVGESASTLGELLQDGGNNVAARALFERALAINERVFGANHARTATSLHLLVVFIPNDLLLYLPIHALTRRAQGREPFLAETHFVSYVTQLELLDLLAPAQRQIDAPLRGVRTTLTMLEGARATKQEFLRLASAFPQLHLATHGVLDPEHPERSYLLFAGADEASQRLSIAEIAGLSLQRGLAILSACDTAVGEQVPGAALITLAAAFSQAGVEAIVASLWKVNDASTPDFMVMFHRELGQGQAVALHRAQIAVLKEPATAHPFYWAAFILIGAR